MVKSYSLGTIKLARWENPKDDGSVSLSYSIEKSYLDDKGEWQKSNSLFTNDLLKLKHLIDKALEDHVKEFESEIK